MLTLYYSIGACSQAPHIILHEAGFAHDSIKVDLKAKHTERGEDYLTVNPKGAVPALRLDNGEILTENAVVLQYLGDQAGGFLLPPVGDFRRYRVLEWLNFVATELHKGFGPFFKPTSEDTKQFARDLVSSKFDFVEGQIGDKPFLLGEAFTLPDAYLFVMLGWTGAARLDLGRWPKLQAYRQRLEQRPSVRRVLEYEGLVPVEAAS
jgi:glutathione S-transferase